MRGQVVERKRNLQGRLLGRKPRSRADRQREEKTSERHGSSVAFAHFRHALPETHLKTSICNPKPSSNGTKNTKSAANAALFAFSVKWLTR